MSKESFGSWLAFWFSFSQAGRLVEEAWLVDSGDDASSGQGVW